MVFPRIAVPVLGALALMAGAAPAHAARLHTDALIDTGRAPAWVTTGFGSVWVVNDHTVARVDPSTNLVVDRIAVGGTGCCLFGPIAVGAGSVWVVNDGQSLVERIDPATDTVVASIPVGALPEGLLVADGSVWVANHRGSPQPSVMRIDPATNSVVDTIPLGLPIGGRGPQYMAAGFGAVWVGVPSLAAVARIDTATDAVTAVVPFPRNAQPAGTLAVTNDAVWASSGAVGHVLVGIDPATNAVRGIIDTDRFITLAFGDGTSAWSLVEGSGPSYPILRRIDEATNTLSTTRNVLPLAFPTISLTWDFGSLWAALGAFQVPGPLGRFAPPAG